MKKLVCIVLAVITCFVFAGCSSATPVADPQEISVALITDTEGIDDNSYNMEVWEAISKYCDEKDYACGNYQPETVKDGAAAIEMAVQDGYSTMIVMGRDNYKAVLRAAKNHPNLSFLLLDGPDTTGKKLPDNLTCVYFRAEELGFIGGVLCATLSSSGVAGFLNGEKDEEALLYEYGFRGGVKYMRMAAGTGTVPDVRYLGTGDDDEKTYYAAGSLYDSDVDIIFEHLGEGGTGLISAASERQMYVIGSDRDYVQNAPGIVLGTVRSRPDLYVDDYLDQVTEGFPGTVGGESISLGIKEGYLDLAHIPMYLNDVYTSVVEGVMTQITKGIVRIPKDRDSLDRFSYIVN